MYYPTCAGGRDLSNNTRISSIQSKRWEKKTKNYVTLTLKFVWKSCSTTCPPFSSKPFPKTFPTEMRRLLNAQQWIENRNMRREERKKRGGEKAKRKSQDCCDTFKPTSKYCFLCLLAELRKLIQWFVGALLMDTLVSGQIYLRSPSRNTRRMLGNPRQSWILDSTSRIPDSGYWIPVFFQWNPWALFRISDSTTTNFPGSGIWIPLRGDENPFF